MSYKKESFLENAYNDVEYSVFMLGPLYCFVGAFIGSLKFGTYGFWGGLVFFPVCCIIYLIGAIVISWFMK